MILTTHHPNVATANALIMTEDIVHLFFSLFGILFPAFSRITIRAETPTRLIVEINMRMIAFDKMSQTVSSSGKVLAGFDAIESIDVDRHSGGRGSESWMVSLQLTDRKIKLGRTLDGVSTAIATAHMSTITGKKVRSLPNWGK